MSDEPFVITDAMMDEAEQKLLRTRMRNDPVVQQLLELQSRVALRERSHLIVIQRDCPGCKAKAGDYCVTGADEDPCPDDPIRRMHMSRQNGKRGGT